MAGSGPDERREAFDRALNRRRLELRLRWADVAERAGVSEEAIRAVRRGPGGVRDLTASGIEHALGLAEGEIRRFLDGDTDTLAVRTDRPGDAPAEWLARALAEAGHSPAQVERFARDLGWARGSTPTGGRPVTWEDAKTIAAATGLTPGQVMVETGAATPEELRLTGGAHFRRREPANGNA